MSDDLAWLKERVEEIRSLFTITETPPLLDEPVYEDHGARVEIKIWMPDGVRTDIRGYVTDISLDRDFVDATAWGDAHQTYLAGHQTFTLRGEVRPWKMKR